MKKTLITSALLFVSIAALAPALSAEEISVLVDVPRARVDVRDMDLATVKISGLSSGVRPGAPALPMRTVRVAIPDGADPSTVQVRVNPISTARIEGLYDVVAAPPMVAFGRRSVSWGAQAGRIEHGRDVDVYSRDAFFPGSWGRLVGEASRLGDYSFAEITVYPVRYNPVSGEILQADALDIRVRFERSAGPRIVEPRRCRREELAARLLENYEQAVTWRGGPCVPPPTGEGLAIITTESIVDDSLLLDDYVQLREAQGHTVTVATEADWDFSTGGLNDARSDRIREWLADHEITLGIGYVLLIGNPDPDGNVLYGIPMKKCAEYDGEAGPTDFFYSSLTGDWDYNGNGTFCEWADKSGITFTPDVYVGRIPVYSNGAAAADDVLARILAYENATQTGDISWRRRMLLPNSIYFFENQYGEGTPRWDGAVVGEWFIRDQLEPRGMEWTTMYEREGLMASSFSSHFQVDTPQLVDQWNRGYGLVFWTGHGSNSGVYRLIWDADNGNDYADWDELLSPEFMGTGFTHMLEDAPPPFVIHGSCSNGNPDAADNLGYNMLRRGAIATVSASRSALTWHWPDVDPEQWDKPDSWDGDVIDIVTEYSVNILDGMEAGRALGEAIAATGNSQAATSWYQKSIQNLYGDPLIRLVMCRSDDECDNGVYCDGEETCEDGSCVPAEAQVECAPTDECDDMICDEEAGACVPGGTCPDAGNDDPATDAGTDPVEDAGDTVSGAKSSCSHAVPDRARPGLLRVLFGVL